jgi:hypothetical protein
LFLKKKLGKSWIWQNGDAPHKLTEEDNVDDDDDKVEPTGKSNTT